ncbi:MAG TPA: ABC transporter permease [Anaerolineales bacterium]|jgi:peptide/nickel transport system permease protein|nr:ABC transporter permease [Anaerolineales bacterium]
MRGYILRRVGQNILTYFFFLTMVYVMIDAQPGDYSNIYLGDPRLTPDQREILRARLGLDKPVTERYVLWLKSFAQGDFGVSFSNYPRQVIDVIIERAPRTLVLFLTATVVAFYMGFLSGKVLAWRRGGFTEYATTIGGVSLYTVFTPWFGLMMIWFFAYTLGWFPIGKFIDPIVWQDSPLSAVELFQRMLVTGMMATLALFAWLLVVQRLETSRRRVASWAGVAVVLAGILAYWLPSGVGKYAADILWHLILPITTLALISFAGTMLLTRNSMLETLREDYIMAARAKGLTEKSIRDKHAARNAMLPVVTSFVFSLAFALDGGVITETIFSWPGMGLTLLRAAVSEDIPMAIGALVFTGALALTAHLVADILYAFLDPRIRYA